MCVPHSTCRAIYYESFDTILYHIVYFGENGHAVYIHPAFHASNFVTECLPKVDLFFVENIMTSLNLHESRLEYNVWINGYDC